jgi:hypothetical protein
MRYYLPVSPPPGRLAAEEPVSLIFFFKLYQQEFFPVPEVYFTITIVSGRILIIFTKTGGNRFLALCQTGQELIVKVMSIL